MGRPVLLRDRRLPGADLRPGRGGRAGRLAVAGSIPARPDERRALLRAGFRAGLADRVEQAAKTRTQAFSLDQIVANLQDDARVLAVCEVLMGRKDFSLLHPLRDLRIRKD